MLFSCSSRDPKVPWHCDTSNSHGDSTVVHRVGVDCGGGICSWVVEFHRFVENILGALTMLGMLERLLFKGHTLVLSVVAASRVSDKPCMKPVIVDSFLKWSAQDGGLQSATGEFALRDSLIRAILFLMQHRSNMSLSNLFT